MATKNSNQAQQTTPEATQLTSDEQKLIERHHKRMAQRKNQRATLARRLSGVMFVQW